MDKVDRFKLNMDENTMRDSWIGLDVKARQLGGVDKLYREHQVLYIQLGMSTGFLTEEEGRDLARQPSITIDG